MDEFGDSDEETAPDAYLARVKREAKERDEEAGGGKCIFIIFMVGSGSLDK